MTAKTPYRSDVRPTPADLADGYFLMGERRGDKIAWDLRDEKYLTQALSKNRKNVLAVYKFHERAAGFPVELVSLGPHMLNKYLVEHTSSSGQDSVEPSKRGFALHKSEIRCSPPPGKRR